MACVGVLKVADASSIKSNVLQKRSYRKQERGLGVSRMQSGAWSLHCRTLSMIEPTSASFLWSTGFLGTA